MLRPMVTRLGASAGGCAAASTRLAMTQPPLLQLSRSSILKAASTPIASTSSAISLRGLQTSARALSSNFGAPTPPQGKISSTIWGYASRRFASSGSAGGAANFLSLPHSSPGYGTPTSVSQPGGWSRLLINVGIVAGAAFAAQIFFNRPTRDAPLSDYVRSYLNSTFAYLGGGLALTAASAIALHRSGFSVRLMRANPWLVLGLGLVASVGGMIGAQTLPPGSLGKYACWGLFNLSQAAVLSPLLFFNPALLARAGLYTAGIVGSLCYVGATAKDDAFLYMGGPLLAGLVVVALSSLSPMILPAHYLRTLAVTESLSMYGGLAVFGGFVLYDTSKVLTHARMAEAGMVRPDPLRESIGLELDFINIFVRMVYLLGGQQRKR